MSHDEVSVHGNCSKSIFVQSVDGKWSLWGACTVTCGGGSLTRTQGCNNPKPTGGGKECVGEKEKLANVTSLNVGVTIQFSSVFFSLSFAKQKTKQTILSCYLVFADGTNYTNLTLFSS